MVPNTAATETLHGMIQVSAGIVPGDSGGPLAAAGQVIGMDTAGEIFTPGGIQSNPLAQAQAREQQNGFGGFGGFNGFGAPAMAPACYSSNTSLTATAPVAVGVLVDRTV